MSELEQIVKVVRKHHLMTVATVGAAGLPWVAHAFYAWVPELTGFVFTTDPATRHGSEMLSSTSVAAGIALETKVVGRVQGIQIEGEVAFLSGEDSSASARLRVAAATARSRYLKRFPYAAAMDLKFWSLTPTTMKLTDNTLGFGTKLIWVAAATRS